MMDEIWKDVIGYEGLYQVSNLGNVRSTKRIVPVKGLRNVRTVTRGGNTLKKHEDRYGYLHVHLRNGESTSTPTIHKLVMNAFVFNIDNKPCIDHINANKKDNRVDNLRWVTVKENQNNPITRKRLSLCKTGDKHHYYGKKFSEEHRKRISDANKNGKCSKPILQLNLEGELIKEHPSINEANRQTGVSRSLIYRSCRCKIRSAGGYVWKYK